MDAPLQYILIALTAFVAVSVVGGILAALSAKVAPISAIEKLKFRFTLRDMFWLVLVAACLSGWWVTSRKLNTLTEQLRRPRTVTFYPQEYESYKKVVIELHPDGMSVKKELREDL